ncbi:MAG: ATP-binding cassette domain-containing protein [Pseudomonadota bacterium]
MISISNLSYYYDRKLILKNINLQIPKGVVTALIGANGAGKSTLLSLIARLISCQQGRITVDDLEVGSCPTSELATRLSILPQVPEVTTRLSVAELVAFGRYPYNRGRKSPEDETIIANAVELFELQDVRRRSLDTLSGGQRQRALLAMIFAQDTDYLLLDEPLNNLDIAGSRKLMTLVRTLAAEHGKTIVIVLHDINYACAYADWIVTMVDGETGPIGEPNKLVTRELIENVFNTDADVHSVGGRPLVAV